MERTLCIIKPDGIENKHIGDIFARIEGENFQILGVKKARLTLEVAKHFYAIHHEMPFFQDLVEYMCSAPVILIALEGENAVQRWRTIIGDTDPSKAAPGTIRRLFGINKEKNTIHGSDSPKNGHIEVAIFFSEQELIDQE